MGESAYSFSLTTFSPSGKLVQACRDSTAPGWTRSPPMPAAARNPPAFPAARRLQIEYALNAVATGATSLGVKAKNGVVIATEKKLPTCLIDETSVEKIVMLTENIAIVYSG
ncbi:hypothetical protein EMIHUDRAFT_257588 [Emiliania huxleyi CCMP1516]|uniref:Proteasome alpha-type subunits domain-containing protein n=2 Tax=Emiliania huxleyi TaxID=2903 RepID=A0A0D3IHU0_EMIH1|nr:hypothetical protein EMIHUDRAFT_257588 [Emiliania huxleyi CCMP1516]EOD10825.1 hypothetical protein EMIHUDRAFT_257588 [Emiliania huxleyi CCMP1516]|eukprot:XP_005763254.1 hypothetical protein EMIHUDRAFT_257588 [Emiliania huxleyi CCMP1516]